MATIQVDIVSAEGEIYSGEAAMVYAPARMGEVGIAPRHAPLLTALKPGEVRVEDPEGKEHFFYITGGMLEIQPHLVTVLADTALRGEQLDEAAALAAQQEAEAALEGASEETDLARARRRNSKGTAKKGSEPFFLRRAASPAAPNAFLQHCFNAPSISF
jgi:F-type H+-transporting ATPase subunit epsilon